MTIGKKSRLNRSTQLLVRDLANTATRKPYLDRWPRFRRVEYPDNFSYQPIQGETWMDIAFNFYGDANLWWVIVEWNRITIHPLDALLAIVEAGSVISMPSRSRVNFEILSFSRNRVKTA